jgi:hypothetical protein
MRTYWHENGEDCVEVNPDGIYRTFTRGTSNHLYEGPSEEAARRSLDWDFETWNRVLMSDPDVEETS